MDGWQILGGDAKRQLHVTTNLLRELDASANFKDGCHLRLGGFESPLHGSHTQVLSLGLKVLCVGRLAQDLSG